MKLKTWKILFILPPLLTLLVLTIAFYYQPPTSKPTLTPESVSAQTTECDENDTNNWCQLQHNPRRTGYSPSNIDWPINNSWAFGFAQSNLNRGRKPERIYPQTQPIIYRNKLFIGTESGTFYAFDASTGAILWEFNNNGSLGPVIGTAGAQSGKVFFASMDSKVYALNSQTGQVEWIFDSDLRSGFSTSVLLAEDKVFIAHRSGKYFALNQIDGRIAWQVTLSGPIFMSSAYHQGKLYVGTNNLVVYSINSLDGNIVWKTNPGAIHGLAFKDYWPVIHNGLVFIRPTRLEGNISGSPALPRQTGLYSQEQKNAQQQIINNYINNPRANNLYIFNQITGDQVIMPHYTASTMNGAVCPPSVDGDNMLIGPVLWLETYGSGWSRLDSKEQRIIEALWDGNQYSSNFDENLCTSGAGRLIFISHVQESNVARSWTWHLDNRISKQTPPYHADNGYFFNNTQGAGTSPSVIANDMVYHTTENTLNARRATVINP